MTWITLDKADGPECPNCGCRATEILKGTSAGTWFGGRQLSRPMKPLGVGQYAETTIPPELACRGTALCSHCGQRFAARLVEGPVLPEAADVLYSDEEPVVDVVAEIADELTETHVAAKEIPYPPRLRCPKCGSRKVKSQSTRQPKPPSTMIRRHHRCLETDCGYTFKSREPIETESER